MDVCTSIMDGYTRYFHSNTHIIYGQDLAFMFSLAQYFLYQFGIKILTASGTNLKSFLVEHGSLTISLMIHLSDYSQYWNHFLWLAMLDYNSLPNSNGLSPFECVIGHIANHCLSPEVTSEAVVKGTFNTYHTKIKKQLAYLRKRLELF